MTATADLPVASLRQSPFSRKFVLYPDRIARGHEVQPLTCVRAEVSAAASGMRGTRFLTIIGPGFAWTQRSDVLREGRCRRFVAKVNATAAGARPSEARAAVPGAGHCRLQRQAGEQEFQRPAPPLGLRARVAHSQNGRTMVGDVATPLA